MSGDDLIQIAFRELQRGIHDAIRRADLEHTSRPIRAELGERVNLTRKIARRSQFDMPMSNREPLNALFGVTLVVNRNLEPWQVRLVYGDTPDA